MKVVQSTVLRSLQCADARSSNHSREPWIKGQGSSCKQPTRLTTLHGAVKGVVAAGWGLQLASRLLPRQGVRVSGKSEPCRRALVTTVKTQMCKLNARRYTLY